jgi:hypothetical protein
VWEAVFSAVPAISGEFLCCQGSGALFCAEVIGESDGSGAGQAVGFETAGEQFFALAGEQVGKAGRHLPSGMDGFSGTIVVIKSYLLR